MQQLGYVVFNSFDTFLPFDCSTAEEECVVYIGEAGVGGPLRTVIAALLVPNRADDPTKTFKINKNDVPGGVRSSIIGVGHTHPKVRDSGISAKDVLAIKRTNLFGIVYHQHTRAVKLYDSTGWIATTTWERV